MEEVVEKYDSTGYLDMELLRFTTAGSVDDGKARLLDVYCMIVNPSSRIRWKLLRLLVNVKVKST